MTNPSQPTGKLDNNLDKLLTDFGSKVWIACLNHSGWEQNETLAAIQALVDEAIPEKLDLSMHSNNSWFGQMVTRF